GFSSNETGAGKNVHPALQTVDLVQQFLVFRAQKRHVLLHLRRSELRLDVLLHTAGVKFAFHIPKADLAGIVEVEIGDLVAFYERKVGRFQVVQPVMIIHEMEIRVVRRNRPVDDLNGIVRTTSDRNQLPPQDVGHFALAWQFDAEGGHWLKLSNGGTRY